jgi:quercetin dioxygenase-like cupin family protein
MTPASKPTVVRWAEREMEDVRPGVRRAGFGGTDALVVMNELRPGMEVRLHSHPEEQIALVLSGRVSFQVGDEHYEIGAGEGILIPSGVVHAGTAIGEQVAVNLDVFAPPRQDYGHLTEWMVDGA